MYPGVSFWTFSRLRCAFVPCPLRLACTGERYGVALGLVPLRVRPTPAVLREGLKSAHIMTWYLQAITVRFAAALSATATGEPARTWCAAAGKDTVSHVLYQRPDGS